MEKEKSGATMPTILVVDDQTANIEILHCILQEEYRVVFATNGQDALKLAKEQKPDLILLDVVMPGMDGYQVCSVLQADPVTHGIPVIFVTSLNDMKYQATGISMGAVEYIVKPIDPDSVLDIVQQCLEKHQ